MVGPYMTARLDENLYLDARAAWGESRNQVSPFGTYEDAFDAERWLVTAALIGEVYSGDLLIMPEARLSWFEETSEAYTDNLNVQIPSVTTSFGTFEFGPSVSQSFDLGGGSSLITTLGATAIWTFNVENGGYASSIAEGLSGRLEFGADYTNGSNMALNGSVFVDGLGRAGLQSWGLQIGVDITF